MCRAELSWSEDDILASTTNFQSCLIGDELVAFYALQFLDEQTAELEAIFIEPAYIGSGIGRLLIEHMKATAISRGSERIVIQGDPHAEEFYLAIGARRRGSRESASISGRQLPLFELLLDRHSLETENEYGRN